MSAPSAGVDSAKIPAYLRVDPDPVYTFGTLGYHGRTNSWLMRAEPQVCMLAKRLFHGCDGRGRGEAIFPNNKRNLADLLWLMTRYPLEVNPEDRTRWDEVRRATLAHVIQRDELNRVMVPESPGPSFRGQLLDFQQNSLAYALTNRRTLIADKMTKGKTPTSLAWLSRIDDWPAIIVPEPHMVKHWERKSAEFLGAERAESAQSDMLTPRITYHTIRGLTPYQLPPAHIYIIHYLLLRGWKRELLDLEARSIIFDEVQQLRHRESAKYAVASAIASEAENVVGLSGTPIYGPGIEIWNILNVINEGCLGDKEYFIREWCYPNDRKYIKDPTLLGEHLRREGLMTRYAPKEENRPTVVQEIDADESVYRKLIRKAMQMAVDSQSVADPFRRHALERRAVDESRRATGVAKAPYVAAFVQSLLEAGESVLVFAHHHDVFDILKDKLKGFSPVFITGRESDKQKERSEDEFEGGITNVCGVGLRCCTGIDRLGRATVVVAAELDYSPAVHAQAHMRAGRLTAKLIAEGKQSDEREIPCFFMVCDVGSDPGMQDYLGLKTQQSVGILGDAEETEEDRTRYNEASRRFMQRVLKSLIETGSQQGMKADNERAEREALLAADEDDEMRDDGDWVQITPDASNVHEDEDEDEDEAAVV